MSADRGKSSIMLVIGRRDLEANHVSVRVHGKGNLGPKARNDVTAEILERIPSRAG